MIVSVDGVSVEIDGNPIVSDASFHVGSGSFHGIVGPNGSGKSTLLRTIYRAIRPSRGAVFLGGDDGWSGLSAKEAARRRAVVAQDSSMDFDFTVNEVVTMGRAPHKGFLDRDDARDQEIVTAALRAVEMAWTSARLLSTLSGGERQRVFLARALAQQAPILVLDEPTNHLDVRAQVELLDLVRSLGLTTIAALHDLDQAVGLCDSVSMMQHGRVVASGAPLEVMTVERIEEVFGVRAHLGTHPLTGRPHVTVAARAAADQSLSGSHPFVPQEF